jgi:hypothetical protein
LIFFISIESKFPIFSAGGTAVGETLLDFRNKEEVMQIPSSFPHCEFDREAVTMSMSDGENSMDSIFLCH